MGLHRKRTEVMFLCMIESKCSPGQDALLAAAEAGTLPSLMDAYLQECRASGEPSKGAKHAEGSFPNLAGFCRLLGCGVSSAERLRREHPSLYDRICAILEDEALNASISPNLLSAYLKRRLGYGEKQESEGVTAECEQLRLVFEHNILEDGQ